VTVTKSAPNVPSWTASAPSSIATAPSTATQAASGQITIPDLTGQNAKIAEDKLEALGFTNVELASATSKYQNVFVPANWTVVGIEPPAGTTVNAGDTVVVKVTKP
jgi:beta-lactam-binding protein with PASTA domain